MQELLKDYQAVMNLPVVWGDMDAAQHVNNTIYLKYSETGRIDFLTKLGFHVNTSGMGESVGPILAEIHCKYKAPLTYPDTVSIASRIKKDSIEEFSLEMEQILVSHKLQRIVAEISTKLVSYDYKLLKKAPIPEKLKAHLLSL